MAWAFLHHDGFDFRMPAPRSIGRLDQIEVWTDAHDWIDVPDATSRLDAYWYGTPLDSDPTQGRPLRKDASDRFDMPTIADVSGPSLLKGISVQFQPRPKGKRKYKRRPKKYEHSLMALREIPSHLDHAVDVLKNAWAQLLSSDTGTRSVVSAAMHAMAAYGGEQVRKECLNQGLVVGPLATDPSLDLRTAIDDLLEDFSGDVKAAFAEVQKRLARRTRMPEATRTKWAADLMEQRLAPLISRYANRTINEGWARGRAHTMHVVLSRFDLAKKKTDDFPIDLSEITIVQTAILDQNLCEECEAVHGETFDYGSDRQKELEPPYERCRGTLGGNVCRCSQLALIGKQAIDIAEVTDEELEDLLQE